MLCFDGVFDVVVKALWPQSRTWPTIYCILCHVVTVFLWLAVVITFH